MNRVTPTIARTIIARRNAGEKFSMIAADLRISCDSARSYYRYYGECGYQPRKSDERRYRTGKSCGDPTPEEIAALAAAIPGRISEYARGDYTDVHAPERRFLEWLRDPERIERLSAVG